MCLPKGWHIVCIAITAIIFLWFMTAAGAVGLIILPEKCSHRERQRKQHCATSETLFAASSICVQLGAVAPARACTAYRNRLVQQVCAKAW